MTKEQELAERFSRDIDKLIENPSRKISSAGMPEEYNRAVGLARYLAADDPAGRCGIRDGLKKRLLAGVLGHQSDRPGAPIDSDELDDDQLDLVAAAGTDFEPPDED
ncbi:hypothetical protein [Desulfoscipio sp. XC116]|uniref:hypothetical protein n=1 Tax=Desulfoscipio sp. XC116 TaxID=3144975 RepID=UPI00325AF83C